MRGMDVLIALRRRRMRPGAVFLTLVPAGHYREPEPLSHYGNVSIDIEACESLASLDLRPLVGLHVQLADITGNPKRLQLLSELALAVDPLLLVTNHADRIEIRRRGEEVQTV